MRYQLLRPAMKACEVGFLHAGGGIPCRPHPAATIHSLFLILISVLVLVFFKFRNKHIASECAKRSTVSATILLLYSYQKGEKETFAGAVFPSTLASGLYNSLYYRTSRCDIHTIFSSICIIFNNGVTIFWNSLAILSNNQIIFSNIHVILSNIHVIFSNIHQCNNVIWILWLLMIINF